MAKKKFWHTEYSVTLLVLFAVIMLFMPMSIRSKTQALYISRWNERYNRLDYMFSVINTHISDDIIKSYNEAKTSAQKEKILLALIKPYLRIDTEKNPPKHYRPRYMNNAKVYKGQTYYFEEFYFAEKNSIIGIKDVPRLNPHDPIFLLMFDINGLLPPNRWGKDIFGVNIYEGGTIEPFGSNLSMDKLKQDCSPEGTGISCSYYYKIGGGFDE